MKSPSISPLNAELIKVAEARHHDPFSVLGRHQSDNQTCIKVFLPYAESVKLSHNNDILKRVEGTDFFEYLVDKEPLPLHYQLSWLDKDGVSHIEYDSYDFPVQLPEFDQHLFGEGKHWHVYQKLGSHLHSVDGVKGV